MSSPSAFRRRAFAGGVVGKKIKIGFAVASARVVSFPSARDTALSGSDSFLSHFAANFFSFSAPFSPLGVTSAMHSAAGARDHFIARLATAPIKESATAPMK